MLASSSKGRHYPVDVAKQMAESMTADGGTIDQLFELFSEVLNVDAVSANALSYACNMTKAIFDISQVGSNNGDKNDSDSHGIENLGTSIWRDTSTGPASRGTFLNRLNTDAQNYVGLGYYSYSRGGLLGRRKQSGAVINLNNVAKAFLSYYAQHMERLAIEPNYNAVKGLKDKSNLVTDDPTYIYKINAGSTISQEDAKSGLFYDTLFNQLCLMGWTENNEVKDQSYLQEMLKNGMMYISSIGDDAYYYQENYSTNTFIKEKSDDSYIAQAEAKYTNQKAKLTSKEDELDLKMKNLDTEISSLTTEYDSVKSVIDKNIEKSFKRYDA